MKQDATTFAREMAAELVDLDNGLPPKLEAELRNQGPSGRQEKFDSGATVVALAALVVQVAQFAYQFHRDRQNDKRLSPEVLKHRLKAELDERGYSDTTDRARVIEAAIQIIERQR